MDRLEKYRKTMVDRDTENWPWHKIASGCGISERTIFNVRFKPIGSLTVGTLLKVQKFFVANGVAFDARGFLPEPGIVNIDSGNPVLQGKQA